MKLVKGLILMFMAVSLVNCGGDDDGGSSFDLSATNFVGTYSLVDIESNSERIIIDNGTTTVLSSETSELNDDVTVTSQVVFNSDGTYSFTGTYVIDYELTDSSGEGEEFSETVITNDSGTYTLDVVNEQIYLFIDGDISADPADIITFTEDRMVLYNTETDVDGQITETFEVTLEFERD